MKKKTIFLTGATGLVGSYLLKILLREGHKVYVLARSTHNQTAEERVDNVLTFWNGKLQTRNLNNLIVIEGDVTKKSLGLAKKDLFFLVKNVEEVFHCAAVTDFNWPISKIRKVNTLGTTNILAFCVQGRGCGILKKANYLSTVFICGNYKGIFKENNLDLGQEFNTSYEQSKFEAERIIERYRKDGLWVDIFRPSLVIGESKTGKIFLFRQIFYQVLRIWKTEIFRYFPGKGFFINIVFVDELCESIVKIAFNTNRRNQNYHTFPNKSFSLENILNISSQIVGFRKPILISLKKFLKNSLTPTQFYLLKNNIFSFNTSAVLDSKWTNYHLEKLGFKFSVPSKINLTRIVQYAKSKNLKRK